jgi:hypothetical protein
MKAQRRSGGIALTIFNLGGGWETVVNATTQATLPPEKGPGTHRRGGCVDPRDV